MKFEYKFVVIPSGGNIGTTDRSKNEILNKNSVLQIKHNVNNCFWYALACLMNPNNRAIRDSRNIKARETIARRLCESCNMEWGIPVNLIYLEKIEEILDCNINVFSLHDIPILGYSINMFNSLVFKTISKNKKTYFII